MNNNRYPLVSVIMPCHNDGVYLKEAVDSLRRQTWPNLELVIIDDGSDDPDTLRAIRDIDFPQKTVLRTEHVGPAAARNRGIEAANGVYILPLDADDTIENSYIREAAEVLTQRDEIGVVYCHADLFGEQQGPWELPDYSLKAELLDNCVFVTAMFRKEDWKAIGGFSEDFRAGMEDYDFWLSMLQTGKEIYQLPGVLFHYRIKPASRTTRFQDSYADVQETYVRLYERHRDLFLKHMDTYCTELRRNLIDQIMINRKTNETLTEIRVEKERLDSMVRSDPLIEYINSLRVLKPGFARFLERLLKGKNKIKKLIGRR